MSFGWCGKCMFWFSKVYPSLHINEKLAETVTVRTGSATVFEIPFVGYPKPEVMWFFNEKDLPKSKRLQVETVSRLTCLRLKSIERGDSGIYTVLVKNSIGEISADITLVVQDKPSAPQKLTVADVTQDSVTLSWKVIIYKYILKIIILTYFILNT